MDFLNNLDTKNKIILGVAVLLVAVALIYYFCIRNSNVQPNNVIIQQALPPQLNPQQLASNIETLNDKKGDLVLFHATWCGYCKSLMPTWLEFSNKYNGMNGINILTIESSEQPNLIQQHQVSGFPMIVYCPNGVNSTNNKIVYSGDRSMPDLIGFFNSL